MRNPWFLTLAVLVCWSLIGSTIAVADVTADETVEAVEEADHDHDEAGHHDGVGHGHAEEHGGAAPDPLATDPDLGIWTLIVFLVMLGLLSQVAWKPIMEGLAARENGITGAIADAEATHEKAKALLAEHAAKLAGAADQVRELLEEARRDAEHTKADILAEAKSAAEAERDRTIRDIEQAKDVAVRQLAEASAGLAIDLAKRVVQQDISPTRQDEIVKEALSRMASTEPSSN